MYAQIVYMAGMGLPFLVAPNIMLPMLGLEPTNDIWIRVLGMLALALVNPPRHGFLARGRGLLLLALYGAYVLVMLRSG